MLDLLSGGFSIREGTNSSVLVVFVIWVGVRCELVVVIWASGSFQGAYSKKFAWGQCNAPCYVERKAMWLGSWHWLGLLFGGVSDEWSWCASGLIGYPVFVSFFWPSDAFADWVFMHIPLSSCPFCVMVGRITWPRCSQFGQLFSWRAGWLIEGLGLYFFSLCSWEHGWPRVLRWDSRRRDF